MPAVSERVALESAVAGQIAPSLIQRSIATQI